MTSTRKIASMVSAVGLGIAMLVLPATAAHAAPTCYATSCTGKNPTTTGCSADAITPVPAVTSPNGVTVMLRYSPACRAAWGKIINGSVGDYVEVQRKDNSSVYQGREITSGTDTYTYMINDAGYLATACYLADIYSVCTRYY